jgi:hypothetical protein
LVLLRPNGARLLHTTRELGATLAGQPTEVEVVAVDRYLLLHVHIVGGPII